MINFNFAYLAGGKLHLKVGQAPVRTVESEFGQSVQERVLQMRRRNAWKNQSIMANFFPAELLQQVNEQDQAILSVGITGLCRGMQGKLLYALEVGEVAGIFTLDQSSINEQRLFHSSDFGVQHLSFHPERNLIACAVVHKNGAANIAVMEAKGSRPKEITEGDSVDLAPKWVPGTGRVLVFQSAGIARNSQGYAIEQGPFTIEKLDFERQDVTCLASDRKYDFLGPQMTADGTLYYIRRPYHPWSRKFNLLGAIRDILLIPFRLLYALFQWLNFFTSRYTGKPLITAGQPRSLDVKKMMVWGSAIDIEMALQRNRKFGDEDAPSLVPRTWQLMRQKPGSSPEVVSEGVLSFDLGEDGSIIYANGSAVYAIRPGGVAERLVVDRSIEQVIMIDSAPTK